MNKQAKIAKAPTVRLIDNNRMVLVGLPSDFAGFAVVDSVTAGREN